MTPPPFIRSSRKHSGLNCFFGSSFPYEDPVSHATYISYICMFFFSPVNLSSVSPTYRAPHREIKIERGKGISFPTMEQGMHIIIGISVCYTSVDIIKMEEVCLEISLNGYAIFIRIIFP